MTTAAATGGDIDTTGAIVGAHVGADGLPAHWLAHCEPGPTWESDRQ